MFGISFQTLFRDLVRHFEFLYGLPLYTRSQTPVPGSLFPVPGISNTPLSFNCLQCLIDVKIFRLIKLHSARNVFFALLCRNVKEIEIFVEQYCINCKGIEKIYIFWLILMGFRIFRVLNKRLYLVYLWGRPLFFWKLGMKDKQFFFCSALIVVCENIFFRCRIPADNFFHACKKISWAFLSKTNFSGTTPLALCRKYRNYFNIFQPH